jgi:hypothetical protein
MLVRGGVLIRLREYPKELREGDVAFGAATDRDREVGVTRTDGLGAARGDDRDGV